MIRTNYFIAGLACVALVASALFIRGQIAPSDPFFTIDNEAIHLHMSGLLSTTNHSYVHKSFKSKWLNSISQILPSRWIPVSGGIARYGFFSQNGIQILGIEANATNGMITTLTIAYSATNDLVLAHEVANSILQKLPPIPNLKILTNAP